MKKIISLILCFFGLLSITSCELIDKIFNPNKDAITSVFVEKTYGASDTIELTYTGLNNKLLHTSSGEIIYGEDFLLYVYDEACTSCLRFRNNVLLPYIKETSLDVYAISKSEGGRLVDTFNKNDYYPRLVLYSSGSAVKTFDANNNPEVFDSVDGLKSALSNYLIESKMVKMDYLLFKDLLDEGFTGAAYYGWNACSDCNYFKQYYLNDALKRNIFSKDFYYIEVAEYRQYKFSEDPTLKQIWDDFSEETYLDINGNRGVVPTLIFYENSIRVDYVVIYNETTTLEDNTLKVTISYSGREDILNKIYASSYYYHLEAKQFYINLFESKMNEHCFLRGV